MIVPVAFVSEHSETLVELDIEYRRVAEAAGVPKYVRVPTVSAHSAFIKGLADLVQRALERPSFVSSETGQRFCPPQFPRCAMQDAALASGKG
jgi:ferrochelatase